MLVRAHRSGVDIAGVTLTAVWRNTGAAAPQGRARVQIVVGEPWPNGSGRGGLNWISKEAVSLTRLFSLMTAVLIAGWALLANAPDALADPLVPPTPAELQYLDQLRQVLTVSKDPLAFNGDGDLLDRGRYACFMRDSNGMVGFMATQTPAAINQLAFLYLCPSAR